MAHNDINYEERYWSDERWNLSESKTSIQIAGQDVDPRAVCAGDRSFDSQLFGLKLTVSLGTLLFELHESEVEVDSSSIVNFILQDIRDDGERAREFYISMVKGALIDPPRPRWFGLLLPKIDHISILWRWVETNKVERDNDFIIIKGLCEKLSE